MLLNIYESLCASSAFSTAYIRRQLVWDRRIELPSPAWKAGIMTIRPIPHKDYFGGYYVKNSQTQRSSSTSQSKRLKGASLLKPISFFLHGIAAALRFYFGEPKPAPYSF